MSRPNDAPSALKGRSAMTWTTSTEVYAHYQQLCAGAPVLTENELRMEVHAAGLRYEDLDDTFWTALFRRPDHRQFA